MSKKAITALCLALTIALTPIISAQNEIISTSTTNDAETYNYPKLDVASQPEWNEGTHQNTTAYRDKLHLDLNYLTNYSGSPTLKGMTLNDTTNTYAVDSTNINITEFNSTFDKQSSFDVSTEDSEPTGLAYNGTHKFMAGNSTNNVTVYNSTNDVVGSYDISGQTTNPRGLVHNETEDHYYLLDKSGNLYEFNSTWDFQTNYTSQASEIDDARGLALRDGTFQTVDSGNEIDEFTTSGYKQSYDISTETSNGWGIIWRSSDGNWIVGGAGEVNEYKGLFSSGKYTGITYTAPSKQLWKNTTIELYRTGTAEVNLTAQTSNDGFSTIVEEQTINDTTLSDGINTYTLDKLTSETKSIRFIYTGNKGSGGDNFRVLSTKIRGEKGPTAVSQEESNPSIKAGNLGTVLYNATLTMSSTSTSSENITEVVWEFGDQKINQSASDTKLYYNYTGTSAQADSISDSDGDGYYEANFTGLSWEIPSDKAVDVTVKYELKINASEDSGYKQGTAYLEKKVPFNRSLNLTGGSDLTVDSLTVTLPIPTDALDVTLYKNGSDVTSGATVSTSTGEVNDTTQLNPGTQINYTETFNEPASSKSTKTTREADLYTKLINATSQAQLSFSNVKANATIDEDLYNIKFEQKIGGSWQPVSKTLKDTDNDGKYDLVDWTISSLSTKEFRVRAGITSGGGGGGGPSKTTIIGSCGDGKNQSWETCKPSYPDCPSTYRLGEYYDVCYCPADVGSCPLNKAKVVEQKTPQKPLMGISNKGIWAILLILGGIGLYLYFKE